MADVEIIFPDKVVGIKPFQLVNLAVTVIGALVAGAMVMWKVRLRPITGLIYACTPGHIQLCAQMPAFFACVRSEPKSCLLPGALKYRQVACVLTYMTVLLGVVLQAQNINMNIIWTAASLILTRCFAVYTQAQTQRTMLQQQMTSSLYDKMQDSQEGVISVITEVGVLLKPCW